VHGGKCATTRASKNRLLGAVTRSKWQHAVSVLSVLRHERFCRMERVQANEGTLRVAWRITAAQQAAAADRASCAGPELFTGERTTAGARRRRRQRDTMVICFGFFLHSCDGFEIFTNDSRMPSRNSQ